MLHRLKNITEKKRLKKRKRSAGKTAAGKRLAEGVLCLSVVFMTVAGQITWAAQTAAPSGEQPSAETAGPGMEQSPDRDTVSQQVLDIAEGIIRWKKADNGAEPDEFLMNDRFLELAGTTAGDWYPIGLGRLGAEDNYEGYLAVIRDQVADRYREPGKLSAAKATEWHRIILAVLACGGDPTDMGTDENGDLIDLVADGTYDRGRTTPLGRQGINGWIWGLIALDSMRYEIPEDGYYTREDIIEEILCRQLADGGFALNGSAADPDITAMAVQALAPYYESDAAYTYTLTDGGEMTKTVRQAVDEALDCLSALQKDEGDFESWGTCNVESTDQVAVALCCLGIDPLQDARFIKNGHTLLDGILRYRMDDGGFAHSFEYDAQNPTADPNKSNSMAGEQTLYTMAAIWRQQNGMRSLYDFRPEQGEGGGEAVFSEEDKRMAEELPENLTTAQYVTVTTLLDKLRRCGEFEGKEGYLQKLTGAKEKIEAIQGEIDSINQDIIEKLYPFEDISLANKETVDEIVARCQALSPEDQKKIEGWEDVVKTKTKVEDQLRGVIIGAALCVVLVVTTFFLVRRLRKRRRKKEREMEELAARYEDEE